MATSLAPAPAKPTPFLTGLLQELSRSSTSPSTNPTAASTNTTAYPQLAQEWDTELNARPFNDIGINSPIKYWWRCQKGHSWPARVAHRTGRHNGKQRSSSLTRPGSNCPDCYNQTRATQTILTRLHKELRRTSRSFTRFAAYHGYKPLLHLPNSRQLFPHLWLSPPPPKLHSLATDTPALLAEWHPYRNGLLTPDLVTPRNGRSIYWRCSIDPTHIWKTSPSARNGSYKTGCPTCALNHNGTSKEQQALENALSASLPFDLSDKRVTTPARTYHCDMVLRSLNLIIEYDGSYWHAKTRTRDKTKTQRLQAAGWTVIRIRQAPLRRLGPNDIIAPKRFHAPTIIKTLLAKLIELDLCAADLLAHPSLS